MQHIDFMHQVAVFIVTQQTEPKTRQLQDEFWGRYPQLVASPPLWKMGKVRLSRLISGLKIKHGQVHPILEHPILAQTTP